MPEHSEAELRAAVDVALRRGTTSVSLERLDGGLRNSNVLVRIADLDDAFVLRIYENDRAIAQKEIDLHRRLRGLVPIADILHAEPDGVDDVLDRRPFALLRFVNGITLRELYRPRDPAAIADAASSIGATLAKIGAFELERPGWLGPGLVPGAGLLDGDDPCPRFVDACLEVPLARDRVARVEELRDAIHDYAWKHASAYAALDREARLVHCDFGSRNVLVRESATSGRWEVAAVLDWEFAVSASPLVDVGHMLRYEPRDATRLEPHFSRAFAEAGGHLPHDWRELSRALDLTALVELLGHASLPEDVANEVLDLLRATVGR